MRWEAVMSLRFRGRYQHLDRSGGCVCCDPRLALFTAKANTAMSRRRFVRGMAAAAGVGACGVPIASAQSISPSAVLFESVRIFDGTSDQLTPPSNVLVVGSIIKTISAAPIAIDPNVAVTRI